VPSRYGDEGNRLGVVANLLDEGGSLLDDFVETVLAPLQKESVSGGSVFFFKKKKNTLVVSILLTATMS